MIVSKEQINSVVTRWHINSLFIKIHKTHIQYINRMFGLITEFHKCLSNRKMTNNTVVHFLAIFYNNLCKQLT